MEQTLADSAEVLDLWYAFLACALRYPSVHVVEPKSGIDINSRSYF